ncbi:MAG TPA: sigma-70 family RNA polymerase sigma factor [Gemmataceae bacterium]|nr:sigma-70 family RNA polymerase sigma factor [Gemmataceae bacterium]
MIPAVTQSHAAAPADPVQAALDDPEVRSGLLDHARAILTRWLGNRPAAVREEAAAEAVQETQLRALQKRPEYDPAVGRIRGWLHGIMNKVLFEIARSLCRQPAQALADSAAWEQLAADLTPQAAEAVPDRLAAAEYLDRLPAEYRQMLQLRFYDGLSHEEIAVRLGISPGNARVRLCRALSAAKALAGVNPREERP